VAGLVTRLPEIERRGGTLVVVGPAGPQHLPAFRAATGYTGPLFVDPARRTFQTAGLVRGWAHVLHPAVVWKGARAFAQGFRQGARQGDVLQQGGTFVLGPGNHVRYEWRDRFAGDHPDLDEVVKALPRG
jgi:peroxiredoxin